MAGKKNSVSWIIVFGICFFISVIVVFYNSRKVDVSDYKKIVCTTFPTYDWTYHIIGGDSTRISYNLIEKTGVDYHYFVPSQYDLDLISKCDLLICNGDEDGKWAEEAARISVENGRKIEVLNLKKLLMNRDGKNQTESVYDEHVWLSVKNAEFFVEEIQKAVSRLDEEGKINYEENARKYQSQLQTLDEDYREVFKAAENYSIIVADRFPFYWLFNDYNVNYFSALKDCQPIYSDEKNRIPESIEKIVSESTMDFLAEKMDEYNLSVIYKLEDSKDKFSRSIILKSNHKLGDAFVLDPLHKATLAEAMKGKTYVKTMRENLEELKKALK